MELAKEIGDNMILEIVDVDNKIELETLDDVL